MNMSTELATLKFHREVRCDALVENETAKHGEAAVQRNRLSDREATHTQRKSHRSERTQRYDGDAGEEGSAHI